jgi:hypothetical protein
MKTESGLRGMVHWMSGRRQAQRDAGKRLVRLHLGDFTLAGLNDLRKQGGGSLDTVVEHATRYYLSEREASQSWSYPRFAKRESGGRQQVSVTLDEELFRAAGKEAERQDVALERLLEHALLYYLAQRSSGR